MSVLILADCTEYAFINPACFAVSSSLGEVKAESVIESSDYTGLEPKPTLGRSDDIEERTEWKMVYRLTKEEKDRLSNIKEEECEEMQSVKMEREDGLRDVEQLGREQEKARDEQKGKGATYLTCQTPKFEKNGVKSEYCQQDMEEGSNLITACLLKQPRVLIHRLKITEFSVPVSQPPCPVASEDHRVRSQRRLHADAALKQKCSLRQKGQVTWKREMIGQLEKPQKQLSTLSENG